MSTAPTADDTRAALARLDARGRKIVIGIFSFMVQEPARVKDREWMAQKLTEVTLLAGEYEADSADQAIRAVQDELREHAPSLLAAALTVFQRVGLDLADRAASGFTFEDALAAAVAYLPEDERTVERAGDDTSDSPDESAN